MSVMVLKGMQEKMITFSGFNARLTSSDLLTDFLNKNSEIIIQSNVVWFVSSCFPVVSMSLYRLFFTEI